MVDPNPTVLRTKSLKWWPEHVVTTSLLDHWWDGGPNA